MFIEEFYSSSREGVYLKPLLALEAFLAVICIHVACILKLAHIWMLILETSQYKNRNMFNKVMDTAICNEIDRYQ